MAKTIRLTMAQALTRFLARQMTVIDGKKLPIFGGVWAIFGHGNVAGIGEALYQVRDSLPTYRAHNEQAMAHAAIGFAKASFRRRFMAATSSIGPGALNMVTAAALAHVNRLPLLLLPGDVFANRVPDPVLQQVESFRRRHGLGQRLLPAGVALFRPHHPARADHPGAGPRHAGADRSGRMRAGDAVALPGRAGRGLRLSRELLRRARVGAAPAASRPRRAFGRRQGAEGGEEAADRRRRRRALFAGVERAQRSSPMQMGIPVCETQGGKSSLPDDHPLNMGGGRRHRHLGRQPAGRGGRSRACRRHPAAGLHHRLLGAVQERGQDHHRAQRPALRCRQAPRAAAGRRRARRARGAAGRAAELQGAGQLDRQCQEGQGRVAGGGRQVHGVHQRGAAFRCAGDRRGAAGDGLRRHRCCMRRAGCRASCTSSGRPARRAPTTPNTASRPWATRSPAGSASRWPSPTRRSSSWSATAPT